LTDARDVPGLLLLAAFRKADQRLEVGPLQTLQNVAWQQNFIEAKGWLTWENGQFTVRNFQMKKKTTLQQGESRQCGMREMRSEILK